jgi:hypothetical protein
MSEQAVFDREAPPWAQRLQTDINALIGRLDRRVKTQNGMLTEAATGLQGQIDTLTTDLDAAEADIVALEGLQRLTSGTYTATTSGTSIDFTGLPAGLKRITVSLVEVSLNATAELVIQIGDSGGVETTTYFSHCATVQTAAQGADVISTGFLIANGTHGASNTYSGQATLALANAATNTWTISGAGTRHGGLASPYFHAGSKALSATLDRIRLTTVAGTAAFDAGGVNILYE